MRVASPLPQPVERMDFLLAFTIAVLFYVLALWRLDVPDQQYFDEIYHVRTAMQFRLGQEPQEWTHPPLAKLLIGTGLKLWGGSFDPANGAWQEKAHYAPRTALGWRYMSVVFGSVALLFLFALARSILGTRTGAVIATSLLALDGVFFVHARIGMTNVFTVCFVLLGTLGTWQFIKSGGGYRWLFLTGLGLGLALATRWSTLYVWGFTGLTLLWYLFAVQWKRWDTPQNKIAGTAKWVGVVVVTMFLIPLAIYMASYIPYVLQGKPEPWVVKLTRWDDPHGWRRIYLWQADMWHYHAGIKETHGYSSPWWSWPIMLRPAWYYYESPNHQVSGIWAVGNPAIWWASVPALVGAGWLGITRKQHGLTLVAVLGLGQWLAWGVEPRPLIFMHYFLETIPYACIAIAYFVQQLWTSEERSERAIALAYGAAVAACFVFFYPLLSAYPISEWYYGQHIWFGRNWV